MVDIAISIAIALWLGTLTSISPCPLATNIAALSYLSKQIVSRKRTLLCGMLYALGRALTYVMLTLLVVMGFFKVPSISLFLQQYVNKLLGPILILTGMALTGLLKLPLVGSDGYISKISCRLKDRGLVSPFFFGILFALAICPTSAAIFFGSLIPLVYKHNSSVALPAIFGLGTAIPVVVFSIILSLGASSLGKYYNFITMIERYARPTTGIVLIVIGIYFTIQYIF